MNRTNVIVIAALILVLAVSTAFSETLVSGEITESNWTMGDSPYILMDDAFVDFNHILEVGPGTVVYGTPEARLQVYGTLIAMGTKGDGEIIFSAVDPDAPWGGIMLMTGAGSTVDLTYATVEYAYSFDRQHGGGINCHDGDLTLLNCTIQHNECYNDGGGVYLHNTEFDISYTFFNYNTANRFGGGLDFAGGDDGTVHHVIFQHNFAQHGGGAVYFYTSGDNIIDHATLYNNQSVDSSLDARFLGSGNSGFTNSILWHEPYNGNPSFNVVNPWQIDYSCVRDPALLVGDSVFVADPLFEDAENGIYLLTENSPCIDAGDPDSEPDPDNSLPDVGRYFFGEIPPVPEELIIELIPIDLLVPARGGYVTFSATAHNNTDLDYTNLTYQIMITAPNTQQYGPFNQNTFDLEAGEMRSADLLGFHVPRVAFSGTYALTGQIEYQNAVLAEDAFNFFKQPALTGECMNPDQWGLAQFVDSWTESQNMPTVPDRFHVEPATPNPFNASTVLHMELPQSDHVEVTVYDIRGRLVAELMDGTMAAGRHSLSFNAQYLPSGAYFIRSSTSHLGSSIQKVMLIK